MELRPSAAGSTRQAAKLPPDRHEAIPPESASQDADPILLRPHHLLCTMAWSGKGYDKAFTEHMDRIVHRLRTEERTPVRLVFCTDELCSACPHLHGPDLCSTNEKVKALDRKTADCFHLEPQTYIYQELICEIRRTAAPELIDHICGDCSWYNVTNCREQVLGLPVGVIGKVPAACHHNDEIAASLLFTVIHNQNI